MNKYVLTFLIILFVVSFFIVITKKSTKPSDEKDSNQVELTYEINAGIPFKWIYEIEDPTIVSFVKSYVIRDDNTDGIVGASVYTNYVFKGLKEGSTIVTFKEISITDENDVVTEEKTTIKVDRDLNTSIVK